MLQRRFLIPAALAAVVACGARSAATLPQTAGDLTLEASLPNSYAAVSDVVELHDGRVAFTDRKNRLFLFGDFAKQSVTTVGEHGDSVPANAPTRTYKFPGAVAHLGGDTLALVDFAVVRTTLFNEKGEAIGGIGFVPAGGATPVLNYDHVGHGYKVDYQAVMGGGEPGRAVLPDSVPLLRLYSNLSKADTVAMLSGPVYGDAQVGEQMQRVAKVFSPNDVFGILPDGTVWIARGSHNRLDWRTPDGKWTIGADRPYTKIQVTAADTARVMARLRERGMPQQVKVSFPFADTKPPFEAGYTRPNGDVWLQQPRTDEGSQIVYDVYARQGAWLRSVTLPAGVALAGFGEKAIYATVKQADGTRKVGRYALK